jgi:hypothetical protein
MYANHTKCVGFARSSIAFVTHDILRI